MNILVTGGSGYIGSHTCVELLNAGHEVTIVDNLSNSKYEAVRRIEAITGRRCAFVKADILDRKALDELFAANAFDAVIHFAGLKAVGESVAKPLYYYGNNITGTVALLETMAEHNVKRMVFSSSATVYGNPRTVPIDESFPLSATNPYGRTKLMIEEILGDLFVADPSWSLALLRYFNPVGAHSSGLIGEDPNGIPNNLVPYISQVAVGKLKCLSVFGDDYPTRDGTGVRDYIHVVDLAAGHLKALDKVTSGTGIGHYNLGTGRGYSVLEMIESFKKASGKEIPYRIAPRRPGDVASCYADPSKALSELKWSARLGIDDMCADAWRWQKNNPDGF